MKVLEPPRPGYIGSHDIGSLVLEDAYGTPPGVYAVKKGHEVIDEDQDHFFWGHVCQKPIIDRWRIKEGIDEDRVQHNDFTYLLDSHPYCGATPDALYTPDSSGLVIIDAKAIASYVAARDFGEPGTDQVPSYLVTQATWFCLCAEELDCNQVLFLVLFPSFGWQIRPYLVEVEDADKEKLFNHAVHFWENHIEKDEPPELDHTASSGKIIKARYEPREDKLLEADESLMEYCQALAELKKTAKEADEAAKTAVNQLKATIGKDYNGIDGLCSIDKRGTLRLK